MKKDNLAVEDDLRPEYDLKSLKVRKLGPGRKSFGRTTEYSVLNRDDVDFKIVDDDSTIKQLVEMGVDLSSGLILAPEINESSEILYSTTTPTLRKLMRFNDIPLIFPHEDKNEVRYLELRSFDWYAPIIVVTSLFSTSNPTAINIALGIITNYLTDFLKGSSFHSKAHLKILIQQENGMDRRIEYSGPVEGIKEISMVINRLLIDNRREYDK
ncbi:MAG: hypothetical protein MH252_05440 [Thermosynechococcaceae cyanobacterium MS004]|nr:hypothetical protein [Thermosynechococcaceae cyanobacterium MS004]